MTDLEQRIAQARARMQALLQEQTARIDWPRERLDGFRQGRLREVLAHATNRSPWHRQRLSHVDVATFRLEHLRELPVMTKADLISDFDAISTESAVTLSRCEEGMERGEALLEGEFVVTASGGTTGVRAISVMRLDDLGATFTAGLMRFVARWRRRSGASGPPEPPFMVVSAAAHHSSGMVKRLVGGDPSRSVSVVDPIADVVAALNGANPSHLIVYSSFVLHLAEEARAGRLRIRPTLVTPVAESFLPEHEAAVAEVWGSVIMSSWGATETGLLGAGSGFDPGMLLLDDMVIVEPVDAGGDPVESGTEASKLLVTPLVPKVLPLVRYELTDQLTVLEGPPSCGSGFTPVSYVRGRQDEEFVYEGGIAVHAHTFRTVLSRDRTIREYQVEQTSNGVVLRAVPAMGADVDRIGLAARIAERLVHVGVADARVEIVVVSDIPRTEGSAKLRRFLPLRTAPRDAAGSRATAPA